MAIVGGLVSDVANECASRLASEGFSKIPGDDEARITCYVRVMHRIISKRPRNVHKAAYSVPDHLKDGEALLLKKVASGDDLFPHQSRQSLKSEFKDGMLNDFGVQHLHLGTEVDSKRANFIRGTKELLFAVVTENDFYAIGIYEHEWTNTDVFEVIQKNWPNLIAEYQINSVVGVTKKYTDDEIKHLRKAGVNVVQQRADGTVHMGLGGGVTLSGESIKVRRDADMFIEYIKEIQRDIIETIQGDANYDQKDIQMSISWNGDAGSVECRNAERKFTIANVIRLPMLR